MSITIKIPYLVVVVAIILTWIISFKTFDSGTNDYGIGALFAFMTSMIASFFYLAVLFGGAYFGWWL